MNQKLLPLTIICGNSPAMIELVKTVIERIDCEEVAMNRYGVIVIRRIQSSINKSTGNANLKLEV